jgi:hypothetical protein
MTQTHDTRVHKKRSESPVVTAVSVGGFFIVVGLVFAMNPGLIQSIGDFFTDLTLKATPFFGDSHFALPAPENPAAHETLYNAVLQFDIGIGILQVILLAFRLMLQSRTGRIAETVGDLVFWFGAAYLVSTFLLVGTLAAWFQYWAALIVVVGFSIIARGIVYLAKNH